EAEALSLRGMLEERMGQLDRAAATLREAIWAAEAGRDVRSLAIAATELSFTTRQPARLGEARDAARHAPAALEAPGGDGGLEALLLNSESMALGDQGKYAESLELDRQALAIRERLFGDRHYTLAQSLGGIGMTLRRLGRHEEALAYHRRAVAVREATVGPDH